MQFPVSTGRGRRGVLRALDGVSLAIEPGETLGLVGESGCGKSTLARCLLRIYEPTGGSIRFDGVEMTSLSARALRPLRRDITMVFQDPQASLNPRRRIVDIVGAPLRDQGVRSRRERVRAATGALELVGLGTEHLNRFPHEFSGGQRQRIGLARALITKPRLLICDEPVSALDVSIQAQMLNLLADIRAELNLTCAFIAHDLSVVRHVADRVAVMYLGRIVETGSTAEIFAAAEHPYTESLIASIPEPDPTVPFADELLLEGDVPSPIDLPTGCRFASRCRFADDLCRREDPVLDRSGGKLHPAACHHPLGAARAFELDSA